MLGKNLPVELLTLQEGFLQNVDETNSVQIPRVQPNSSSVVLARFCDVQPGLENRNPITQDELSLIVIGQCHHENLEECRKIRVPVMLKNEPLVCLHHLGAKKAELAIEEQHQFPVNETQEVSVTGFKDEISEDTWLKLIRSLVKCIMQILSHEAGEVELLSPPWGRSYQKSGKRCEADMSTSMQIHVRLAKLSCAEF